MVGSYARIGSVSSGTMRMEDVIPAYLDALGDIRERIAGEVVQTAEAGIAQRRAVRRLDNLTQDIETRMDEEGYYDSEDAGEDANALADELSDHAPPYCYFGAAEGDGADYGFWIAWDSLADGDHTTNGGCVLKIDAGDDWRVFTDTPGEIEYVLEVNDHGNVALRTPGGEEVWSVV